MRHTICSFAAILALLCPITAVLATDAEARQDPDRPVLRRLLETWMTSQRDGWSRIAAVRFDERVDWNMDSPFGSRRLQMHARVEREPGSRRVSRETIEARLNGRRVSRSELDRAEQQRANLARDASDGLRAFMDFLPRYMAMLSPEGPPTPEPVNGRGAARVEFLPRSPDAPIDRATLWFEPNAGLLLRSRVVVAGRGGRSNFVMTTEFERVNGLDIPVRRSVEGTVQNRRRTRVFTTLLTYRADYSNFQLVPRE